MAIDERSRHELHRRLDDVLGQQAADTLLAHLPRWAGPTSRPSATSTPWRSGSTSGFVAADERLIATEQRILATLRGEMIAQTRTMVYANMASVFTGVSLAFVAARLG